MMNVLLTFIGLVGLAWFMQADAAEPPACVITAEHPLIGDTRWYGLYYEDTKIGHAETSMAFEPPVASIALEPGEADRETITQRFAMTFKLERTEETIERIRRFDARPPHRLLNGMFRTADRQIVYQQQDGDLHLHEDGMTRIWSGVDRLLCDEEDIALRAFLKSEPEIGTSIETTDIDVEHQVLSTTTHDLDEVGNRRILGADHVFQSLRIDASSEVLSYTAKAHFLNGEAVNLFIGPIELRAESEAIAHQPNQGVDLFAEFEKPLDRPLARLSAIETLTLKASVDDPEVSIEDVVSDAFWQRVIYVDDQTAVVEIGRHGAPEDELSNAAYLRPTSTHPADHPRLKALVDEILAPLEEDAEDPIVAAAILDFVAGYIENVPESPYAYHTTSVFDVLDERTGDCTEHSQLFVTLARAAGLPAREVSGFVYSGDDRAPSLGGHAWVEVLIDGEWVGMDPTWEEIELNRSHVQTENILVPSLAFEVVDIAYH